MLDHVTIFVASLARSIAFYDHALAAIGIERLHTYDGAYAGYGAGEKACFWIGERDAAVSGVHIAFAVPSRDLVTRFHEAALAAGGKDNGAPGLRPHYHENYFGAFVLDLDGHNIEAVCHGDHD